MRKDHVRLLVGGVALTIALGAAVLVSLRLDAAARAQAPLAVVLVPDLRGSSLVSVDLDTGRVVGTVRLRSLATDIEADTASSLVVAAQTGGIAGAADDALSITDPRTGDVSYVRLPQIDPSQVEVVSGRAMVLHSIVEEEGFVSSAVDVATAKLAGQGHVPDGTGLWAAAGGRVWTAVATQGPVPFALVGVDPSTLATEPGPWLGFSPFGVSLAGDSVLVVGGSGPAGAMSARVALLDSRTASVTASAAVAGLPHGAQYGVIAGDLLVIGDWNGEAPETDTLQVLDRTTLAPVRTIRVEGAPCALAPYDSSVLVVERLSGALYCVDARTGETKWRTALGTTDLVCSKIVVLPRGATATRGRKPDEPARAAMRKARSAG